MLFKYINDANFFQKCSKVEYNPIKLLNTYINNAPTQKNFLAINLIVNCAKQCLSIVLLWSKPKGLHTPWISKSIDKGVIKTANKPLKIKKKLKRLKIFKWRLIKKTVIKKKHITSKNRDSNYMFSRLCIHWDKPPQRVQYAYKLKSFKKIRKNNISYTTTQFSKFFFKNKKNSHLDNRRTAFDKLKHIYINKLMYYLHNNHSNNKKIKKILNITHPKKKKKIYLNKFYFLDLRRKEESVLCNFYSNKKTIIKSPLMYTPVVTHVVNKSKNVNCAPIKITLIKYKNFKLVLYTYKNSLVGGLNTQFGLNTKNKSQTISTKLNILFKIKIKQLYYNDNCLYFYTNFMLPEFNYYSKVKKHSYFYEKEYKSKFVGLNCAVNNSHWYQHSNYTGSNSLNPKSAVGVYKQNNVSNYYVQIMSTFFDFFLLSFLQNMLKTKIWIRILTQYQIDAVLTKYCFNFLKINAFKYRRVSKHINIAELLRILIITFKTKDLTIFLLFIKSILENAHFKNHKKILNTMFDLIKKNDSLLDVSRLKGFSFDIRGKVGVSGNAKKRHLFFSIGKNSTTTQQLKSEFQQISIWTPTGQMGITCIILH